jgi:hypothetical protein
VIEEDEIKQNGDMAQEERYGQTTIIRSRPATPTQLVGSHRDQMPKSSPAVCRIG